jgi:starch synthase
MKGAIAAADRVVTVSESYAWEVTQPSHGAGLHAVLAAAAHRLTGIVNGIDHTLWDPSSDPHLAQNFSPGGEDGGGIAPARLACKAALRRELRLPEPDYDVDVPLVAFVGRLDPQRGVDIILEALPGLLSLDCQVRRACRLW